jgi:hypothetical protein
MKPALHKFENDLKQKPPPGVNAPPIGIRAKDLDENFNKVTIVESTDIPKPYNVKYTKDGAMLVNLKTVPDGEIDGDILFWNSGANKWQVFPAVLSDELRVLGLKNGVLGWIKTEDC